MSVFTGTGSSATFLASNDDGDCPPGITSDGCPHGRRGALRRAHPAATTSVDGMVVAVPAPFVA